MTETGNPFRKPVMRRIVWRRPAVDVDGCMEANVGKVQQTKRKGNARQRKVRDFTLLPCNPGDGPQGPEDGLG